MESQHYQKQYLVSQVCWAKKQPSAAALEIPCSTAIFSQ
jgi:hypothetical protein